ncbi:MAG: Spo0E family sporulation regulatory protein-aspartic acid phosphatase [Bacillota bacterium]|nr:Spo0E family sporulation regulatory protein-aspartic acid phosphatase [Bacillota bacterium]
MLEQLEKLRIQLYEVMDTGNTEDILRISRELDDLILFFTKSYYKSINAQN